MQQNVYYKFFVQFIIYFYYHEEHEVNEEKEWLKSFVLDIILIKHMK